MTSTMTPTGTWYVALELGQDKWLLACATQAAPKPRFRAVPARDRGRLQEAIATAKQRFGLPAEVPVCPCYEAGRAGFWLHRCRNRITGLLASQGFEVQVAADLRVTLDALRDWAGQPAPAGLLERVLQAFAGWATLHRPVRDAANAQERRREGKEP
jgi:hypothetical protein